MIIIRRNGRTIVLRGWRAWLAGAAALIIAWLLLALFVFIAVGMTITIGAFILLLLPALFVVGVLANVFRSHRI